MILRPPTDADKSEVGPAPQGVDLELVRALLKVGVLPSMVTPIIDPVVEPSVTPVLYPVPPIPVLSVADPVPVLVASPLRQVGGNPVRDQSLSYLVSPSGSVSEPIPSRISLLLRTDDVSGVRHGPDGPVLAAGCFIVVGGVNGLPFPAGPSDSSSDNREAGFWVPNQGACCCGLTEYVGLVSGGPL